MMRLSENGQRFVGVLFLLCLATAGLYAQEQKLVPVPIELPKPGYAGTPANIDWSQVEKPGSKPRGPFLAPPGVTNVAKGKKVTSSEKEPLAGDLTMITDGDKKQSDFSCVVLGSGLQQVTIDLGALHNIYAILFWHFHNQIVYYCVIVQTADDAAFTKNVQTHFNNDRDNASKLGAGKHMLYVENYQGKLVDTKGVRGRYVRLYSYGNNTNDLNHYIEVEVFGIPAK
jgi:hypothetical protein